MVLIDIFHAAFSLFDIIYLDMASLNELLDQLDRHYGPLLPPEITDPFEMILWENVAYLADDEKRKETFSLLKKQVGLKPHQILATPLKTLREVTKRGGIMPDQSAQKLLEAAAIAAREFGGNLQSILDLPVAKAKKALKKFPGIGEPGAEKILLFCRKLPVLALESNGVRVLLRLGYGSEETSYSVSYRCIRKSVETQLVSEFDWLIRAHQLLRHHGQQICKRNFPFCSECPVSRDCDYYKKHH